MNKPFLLMAGDWYYPTAKTGDWIGCYTKEDIPKVTLIENKSGRYTDVQYLINGRKYDWYEIVDLRKWVD